LVEDNSYLTGKGIDLQETDKDLEIKVMDKYTNSQFNINRDCREEFL